MRRAGIPEAECAKRAIVVECGAQARLAHLQLYRWVREYSSIDDAAAALPSSALLALPRPPLCRNTPLHSQCALTMHRLLR
jgi:hypothetical protein